MATLFHPRPNYMPVEREHVKHSNAIWAVPIGRTLFSLIFLISGFTHFSSGSVSYADSQGIPMADILVPVSGLMAIVGGLSVLSGLHARVGAVILLLFLVPVTILMHDFWNVPDPQMAQMQMVNFLKNLGLIGGALLITFYGAGPVSLDQRERRNARRRNL
jgi:putative oxidoreductase